MANAPDSPPIETPGERTAPGVLRLSGVDVWRFLQNQTTQDVLSLKPSQWVWNAAVDRHGKVQAIFSLHRMPDDSALLVTHREAVRPLIEHFSKFRILEDVQFTDCTDITDSGTPIPPADSGDLRAFGNPTVSALEAGAPGWHELSMGLLLPETGWAERCVSYTKGCYLGQEVIAKMKTYGGTPRLLMGLILDDPPDGATGNTLRQNALNDLSLPLSLDASGKPAGTLTRLAYSPERQQWIAMALLNREARQQNKPLILGLPDGAQTHWRIHPFPLTDAQGEPAKANPELARQKLTDGLAAFARGNDETAVRLLEEATTLDDSLVDAWEALGAILSRHERVDEAMAAMERIVALDADHVMAHTNLSVLWLKKGDKDKAEEEKAKALVARMRQGAKASGVDMAKLEAERQAAEAAKKTQLQERITLFQEALKHSPEDPLGNFGLASALLEMGRFAEAIEPFRKTIAGQPKHSVAYLSLGKAFEGSNQPAEAAAIYRQGIGVAAGRGDLMPQQEMERRLAALGRDA
ncbi:MAG: tetratricopeptide repeat protein [Candidatus Melainabacteria bacterium]